jgi:hypothetical protein
VSPLSVRQCSARGLESDLGSLYRHHPRARFAHAVHAGRVPALEEGASRLVLCCDLHRSRWHRPTLPRSNSALNLRFHACLLVLQANKGDGKGGKKPLMGAELSTMSSSPRA